MLSGQHQPAQAQACPQRPLLLLCYQAMPLDLSHCPCTHLPLPGYHILMLSLTPGRASSRKPSSPWLKWEPVVRTTQAKLWLGRNTRAREKCVGKEELDEASEDKLQESHNPAPTPVPPE